MKQLVLQHDWASTALGPMSAWPPHLRQAVGICLASQFPMVILWGPRLLQIYNDGYRAMMADKHPAGLGQPAHECWPEGAAFNEPIYQRVLRDGETVFLDDQEYAIHRRGFLEEAYSTVSYGPVHDDHGEIGGVFIIAIETTARVLLDRRQRTLQQLAACAAQARTVAGAAEDAAAILKRDPADLPFALVYLVKAGQARLAGAAGLSPGDRFAPEMVDLAEAGGLWRIGQAAVTGQPQLIRTSFAGLPHVVGPVLALPAGIIDGASAVAVLATSARLPLDEGYRSFLDSVATTVSLALTSAHTHETERHRSEALAAADRAKTALLHSVSHEFRTPLTLLLGPLGELLSAPSSGSLGSHRDQLRTAHRAALRLSRLVDALLLAAQAEAGHLDTCPQPTDLARSTAELAGMFRSAIEQAGLRLTLDCPPLPSPVLVDPSFWEHIVLNLLSNAVKFTPAGEIGVRLRADKDHVHLAVSDTGVGIPSDALPRIFDRFYRAGDDRARSTEGAGIGLSLVADMTTMLGGTVDVASEPGAGTTFTVRIPYRKAEVSAAPARNVAARAAPFVAETAGWRDPIERGRPGEILVVEDNADLRDHLVRLLSEQDWTVDVAPDGQAALDRVRRHRPQLILTDLIMPRLDGIGLVRALRTAPDTARIPVLLLTARADSASVTEGLEAGADDYIVKPFDAGELIARVRVNLDLFRSREARLNNLATAINTHDIIGQAMGILMERRHINAQEAFNLLRTWSQTHNVKIATIAETLILRHDQSTPP